MCKLAAERAKEDARIRRRILAWDDFKACQLLEGCLVDRNLFIIKFFSVEASYVELAVIGAADDGFALFKPDARNLFTMSLVVVYQCICKLIKNKNTACLSTDGNRAIVDCHCGDHVGLVKVFYHEKRNVAEQGQLHRIALAFFH
jgi:hypothetical protein